MIDTLQLLKPLEAELLAEVSAVAVHWCRRGTTAGAWAFKAAALNRPDISEPEVILPSTACSTMPAAAYLAGCQIRFADVSLKDALPSLDSINAVMTERTVAVLFIHMFGNTADLDQLHTMLKSRRILLIEDAAQAFGGHTPSGKPLGSTGEMTLHGFTDNKILESGGGALVVREQVYNELVKQARGLLPVPPELSRETYGRYDRSFQSLYNGLVEFQRLSLNGSNRDGAYKDAPQTSFASLIHAYSDWFMQTEPPTMRLSFERRHLEASIAHRLEMARYYRDLIPDTIGDHINNFQASGNCWRYTLLLNESISQESFISGLRRKGFQATDLYWPLDTLLGNGEDACPNALEIGRTVVNLPVDKSVSLEMIKEMVKRMKIEAGV